MQIFCYKNVHTAGIFKIKICQMKYGTMGDYEQKYYMYVPKSQDADFHNNIIIVVAIPPIILPQRLVILHSDPVAWFEPSLTCSKRDGGRGRDATLLKLDNSEVQKN